MNSIISGYPEVLTVKSGPIMVPKIALDQGLAVTPQPLPERLPK